MAEPRRLGGPGFAIVEAARAAMERYSMLDEGEKVVVAVSGGPDSTCLFDVLARLSTQHDHELVVAHVDHGLSEGSEAIAAEVARLAAEAGFDAHVARARDLSGPNLHARAREFRYSFFETIARDAGATKIATGHTLDDRVETTLARLVHGAGTEGLAGIPPVAAMRIRPLIGVRRAETRRYCDENSLSYFDDPTNEDPRFDRARVRTHLVAAIEEQWGPGAIEAIASATDSLRDDAAALDLLAARLAQDLVRGEEGARTIAREPLLELPRALRRRVLERAVGRVRDRSGGIEAALDALDRGGSGLSFAVASGIQIELDGSEVRVSRMPK